MAVRSETQKRIEKAREYMDKRSLSGILFTSPENVFYMSGFTGYGDADLLITKDKQYILTDFRYNEQVKVECPEYVQINQNSENMKATGALLLENGLARVGYENRTVLFSAMEELKKSSKGVRLVKIDDFTEGLRIVKSEE